MERKDVDAGDVVEVAKPDHSQGELSDDQLEAISGGKPSFWTLLGTIISPIFGTRIGGGTSDDPNESS